MTSRDKTAPSAAALATLDRRLERLEAAMGTLVALAQREHSPTAMAHHLLKLEEALLARCALLVNRGSRYLTRMAEDEGGGDGEMAGLLSMLGAGLGVNVEPETMAKPRGGKG